MQLQMQRAGTEAKDRGQTAPRTGGVLLVVLVELIVAATVGWGLWTLRRETLASELQALASLSAAMAVQADRHAGGGRRHPGGDGGPNWATACWIRPVLVRTTSCAPAPTRCRCSAPC